MRARLWCSLPTTWRRRSGSATASRSSIRGRIVAVDTPRALVQRLDAPYVISIVTDKPLDLPEVEALEGVIEVEQHSEPEGSRAEIHATEAAMVTVALARMATDVEAEILHLVVQSATLEEVYFTLTGQVLGDEEPGEDTVTEPDPDTSQADS